MPHTLTLTPGWLQWFRASRWSVFFVFLLIASLPLMGCFGEFALTKELYRFNSDCSPYSLVQSVVMWVLALLWVYPAAIVVDVVIFNLVEFWSGQNPITAKTTYDNPDGSQVVMTPSEDGNELTVEVVRDGSTVDTRRIIRTSGTHCDVLDAKGSLVGGVERNSEGGLEFSRPGSERRSVLTPEMLSQFRTHQASGTPVAP